MKTTRTTLMALALITLTTFGVAGIANARGHYGQGMHNDSYNGSYSNLTPEQRAEMQKAYDTINPLSQQLYAKRVELNAQIAAGADDKSIKGLVGEVNALSAKLVEAQASTQRQMAKSGIPFDRSTMNCMMDGNGGYDGMRHGSGMGHGNGYGNGMRHNGGMQYDGDMRHGSGMRHNNW